ERFWSGSLARAVAAQYIARVSRLGDPAEAFTLGLLARVGSLALASVHPESYGRMLEEHNGRAGAALLEAESRAFGIDQHEVTAAMLSDWGLPETFAGALQAWAGHDGEAASDAQVEGLVRMLELSAGVSDLLLSDRRAEAEAFERRWQELLQAARALGWAQPE